MQPKITITMKHAKTTPGTQVYTELTDKTRAEQTVPTLYVQKAALTDPPPAMITVTIESQ